MILPENLIRPILGAILDQLARFGFKVVVLVNGLYPQEQVNMVHKLAAEANQRFPGVRFIGLTEPEITTPLHGVWVKGADRDFGRSDASASYLRKSGWAFVVPELMSWRTPTLLQKPILVCLFGEGIVKGIVIQSR